MCQSLTVASQLAYQLVFSVRFSAGILTKLRMDFDCIFRNGWPWLKKELILVAVWSFCGFWMIRESLFRQVSASLFSVEVWDLWSLLVCLCTAYKADGKWHGITFREYYHKVRTAAKAFIKVQHPLSLIVTQRQHSLPHFISKSFLSCLV